MDIASRSRMSVPARRQSDGSTSYHRVVPGEGLTMLKHSLPGTPAA